MPISNVVTRTSLAASYATLSPYLSLLQAITMGATANASGSPVTINSDLLVQVGDIFYFDQGGGTQENHTVTAVSGSGPYLCTIPSLTTTRASGFLVSHIPISSTSVHELASITRIAAGWGTAAASVVTSATVNFAVLINQKVGALSYHSAITAGTFNDADPVAAQLFASAGTYSPTAVYTQA